ncbi:HNH homing endonuclease [Enterococcus phage IME-EF4]|uniref:HNH homing endonuclease n=1 Tax=Enterococcus phage IME-EF4 TaxID=1432658 RepID=V5UPU5_9CAUD|nr:HNH homing endonuclease [Enterococcus phage IME-EF4]AHB79829.1 HNH homing endonuclease [Enterococcus phage IME-EF4]
MNQLENANYEEWRTIKGYEGRYEVSDLGRVRSVTHLSWNGYCYWQKDGCMLSQRIQRAGYYVVDLTLNKQKKTKLVHRLVAEAFISDIGTNVVNHIDENRLNNHLDNLEIVSQNKNLHKSSKFNKYMDRLRQPITIYDKQINSMMTFNSKTEACDYYNLSTSYFSMLQSRNKGENNRFKIISEEND